jgi:hypothetical protein
VKIRPMAVELYHADGETDMKKQMVALCNYTNMPKIFLLDVVSFLS